MSPSSEQVVSGNSESTFLNQGLQSLGMSSEAAGFVEMALGVGAAATAGAVANKAIDQRAALNKLSRTSYQSFIVNGGDKVSSPIVNNGGLAAHEAAGGHLLLKHVGQSEIQLIQRLVNEPGISGSSSFYNRASAESAISRTLDAKQAEINSWLSSSKPQMKIEYTLPENVGITIDRGMKNAVDTSNLQLILRRDSSFPTGYRVHTGFPKK